MATLIDTSALYVLIDELDPDHAAALAILDRLRTDDMDLVMHSYALGETIALLQRRFGLDAVRRLVDVFLPIIEVAWVDPDLHHRAPQRPANYQPDRQQRPAAEAEPA